MYYRVWGQHYMDDWFGMSNCMQHAHAYVGVCVSAYYRTSAALLYTGKHNRQWKVSTMVTA